MDSRHFKRALPLALLAACVAVAVAASGEKDYHPVVDAANFVTVVDNAYFPLVPGAVYKYVEKSGKDTAETEMTVTHDTKTIMGVTCVVVHSVVNEKGKLAEETFDWFAQDKAGNVWYFGEDTKEMHNGKFSPEGSWEAGVRKNQPGMIMPAHPAPGQPFRQEYSPGNAEDMGQIVAVKETMTVPAGTFHDCVRTKEWSLLAAGSEKKWYAPGIGCIKEVSPEGDVNELISVIKAE
ncbi:MAG TPA: hypothetical protein VJS69_14015 [Candidatus Krumholzibacteria bacterium]|nr:hypothetical protein [Candidatus Krumholzibacteria bacterium]